MKGDTPNFDPKPVTLKRIVWTAVGLIGCFSGITVLYSVMRAVMGVGGFCAEGGPYEIAVHCPGNTEFLAPLSIFTMIIGVFIYLGSKLENGPDWTLFFWSILFLSLGWNFLDFGLNPPGGDGAAWAWLINAVFFGLMGLGPIALVGTSEIGTLLFGKQSGQTTGPMSFLASRNFLLFLHLASAAVGIVLGFYVLGLGS